MFSRVSRPTVRPSSDDLEAGQPGLAQQFDRRDEQRVGLDLADLPRRLRLRPARRGRPAARPCIRASRVKTPGDPVGSSITGKSCCEPAEEQVDGVAEGVAGREGLELGQHRVADRHARQRQPLLDLRAPRPAPIQTNRAISIRNGLPLRARESEDDRHELPDRGRDPGRPAVVHPHRQQGPQHPAAVHREGGQEVEQRRGRR